MPKKTTYLIVGGKLPGGSGRSFLGYIQDNEKKFPDFYSFVKEEFTQSNWKHWGFTTAEFKNHDEKVKNTFINNYFEDYEGSKGKTRPALPFFSVHVWEASHLDRVLKKLKNMGAMTADQLEKAVAECVLQLAAEFPENFASSPMVMWIEPEMKKRLVAEKFNQDPEVKCDDSQSEHGKDNREFVEKCQACLATESLLQEEKEAKGAVEKALESANGISNQQNKEIMDLKEKLARREVEIEKLKTEVADWEGEGAEFANKEKEWSNAFEDKKQKYAEKLEEGKKEKDAVIEQYETKLKEVEQKRKEEKEELIRNGIKEVALSADDLEEFFQKNEDKLEDLKSDMKEVKEAVGSLGKVEEGVKLIKKEFKDSRKRNVKSMVSSIATQLAQIDLGQQNNSTKIEVMKDDLRLLTVNTTITARKLDNLPSDVGLEDLKSVSPPCANEAEIKPPTQVKELLLNHEAAPDSSNVVLVGDRFVDVMKTFFVDFSYDLLHSANFFTSSVARLKEMMIGDKLGPTLNQIPDKGKLKKLVVSVGRDDLILDPDWLSAREVKDLISQTDMIETNLKVAERVAQKVVFLLKKVGEFFPETTVLYLIPCPSHSEEKVFETFRNQIKSKCDEVGNNVKMVDAENALVGVDSKAAEEEGGAGAISWIGSRKVANFLFQEIMPEFSEVLCDDCFGFHTVSKTCPGINMVLPSMSEQGVCFFCWESGHQVRIPRIV